MRFPSPNVSSELKRKLCLLVGLLVLLGLGGGCNSAAKSNYIRHLNTSLRPTRVVMRAEPAPAAASPDLGPQRIVAAADVARVVQSH